MVTLAVLQSPVAESCSLHFDKTNSYINSVFALGFVFSQVQGIEQ